MLFPSHERQKRENIEGKNSNIFNCLETMLLFLNLRSSQKELCISGVQFVCRSFEIHNAESPQGRQHDEKR